MTHTFIEELANAYALPVAEVEEGVAFVLGRQFDLDEDVEPEDASRLHNYFSALHNPHHRGDNNPDSEERIARLVVKRWRQFNEIDLDLGSRLTILTGENGTGKTSLLSLVGQSFGLGLNFLGTPTRDKNGFSFRHSNKTSDGNDGAFEQFGFITFQSGAGSRIGTRQWGYATDPSFSPELLPYRNLPGLYLDATRVIGPYQRLDSMPARFTPAKEIASNYQQQVRNMWTPNALVKSPALMIKEALVAAAMYGEGNSAVVGDPVAARVWKGFQEVLHLIFPTSLGFHGLQVDQGEIVIRTQSGNFALEASSGGLAALVTLSWQIYLHQFDSPNTFTVCFDEPENHLHPSMQRTLLPALLKAFPTVNFVVATHSPFIVTSMKEASIYALRRDANGFVSSSKIDLHTQIVTADEVLSEVLGVDVTMPLWAENELTNLISSFTAQNARFDLQGLMNQLDNAGLRISMPDVAEAITAAIENSGRGGKR